MPIIISRRAAFAVIAAVVLIGALLVGREVTRPVGPPRSLTATLPLPPPRKPRPYDPKEAHRPSPLPDRVVLTWAGDPATTQAVTWRTDMSVKSAVAEYAVSADGPEFSKPGKDGKVAARAVRAATTKLSADLGDAQYHSAKFKGLTPKTKYVYRVGDGTNWSEWFQFETAGREPEPFSFLYFGDAQNDIKEHWSRVVRGAYSEMPKARFIVHAGDLVDNGGSDAQWGEWHGAAGWINGMVPVVPSAGNHEYLGGTRSGLTSHWRSQFALPEHGPPGLEESCYWFDFQGTRVICLNSNEKHAEQAKWLEGLLATNPNRWTVLTFHHPIYSPGGRDNKGVREAWRPLIDKYRVDLVLTGHDHTYARSGMMQEDNLMSGANARSESGTVYVVSVSGPKLYTVEMDSKWMSRAGDGKQLYQHITIDGYKLRYESRTARGDRFDSFELHKRAHGPNILVEEGQTPPPPPELPPLLSPSPAVARASVVPEPPRGYGSAAAAVVVVAAVLLGLRWAVRRA